MAGIYIHIPFCSKACHYCNFYFSTSRQRIPEMVRAINKEAEIQRFYLSEKIDTIYFGGGTPSLLSTREIQSILSVIRSLFTVEEGAEISLEANPDDITEETVAGWKESGINRLSIGIQSFVESDLQWMNRAHTVTQAKAAILLAQKQGITTISIDLIYGTPLLTDAAWKENVTTAISLNIPHLSCYALTVEPRTALAKMIHTKRLPDVDPEKQARHFTLLTEWMAEAGFEHYEISNFALPGFRSKHNSSYWQGKPYLGLGPSAHSFNGKSRQWNIANNSLYLKSIENAAVPFEIELLSEGQQLNEFIMTRLRTMEGIPLKQVTTGWGEGKAMEIIETAQKHILLGHLVHVNDFVKLTGTGQFLADGIAADLFSNETQQTF
ncbi:MAG: radical SAM family heme chaperone HemW [Sediminibacterium sp.]|nr:radical SAM family heme chaperone HemW [Sediminibacterium sp.]